MEAATRTSYDTAMRRIIDTIGAFDAKELTTPRLVRWREDLVTEYGVSDPAAARCVTALSSMYQRGVEWGIVDHNPVRGVKNPRGVRTTVEIPNAGDIARLGLTAPTPQARAMLLTACYSGVRQGELFALRPSDVRHGRLRVAGAIGGDGKLKTTKTRGERIIPLPAEVYEHLLDHAQLVSGEWLFPNSRGSSWDKTGFRRNVFVPWKQAAGVPHVQWRHLRHYYASNISAVGASILQCSRWMGHASIVTTMDRYGFLFDSDEARVMDALAAR